MMLTRGVAKSRARLSDFTFTFHFHALEKEMTTHSSILAWRIPGTGDPSGLPSMGSHRVGHDWSDLAAAAASFQSLYIFIQCRQNMVFYFNSHALRHRKIMTNSVEIAFINRMTHVHSSYLKLVIIQDFFIFHSLGLVSGNTVIR